MDRRNFLHGLLTVAAASIVPLAAQDTDVPKIVGDGVHDDAPGINAAINGRPFSADGLVIRDQNYVRFGAGPFRMASPMRLETSDVVVEGASFTKITCDHEGAAGSFEPGAERTAVSGFWFVASEGKQLRVGVEIATSGQDGGA